MPLRRGAVLEPGDRVAQRDDAEPHHRRARRRVGHAVEPALLEAAVEPDVARVGYHAPRLHAREAPAAPLDELGLAVGLLLHGELGVPLVEVGGRVRQVPAIGEQEVRSRRVALELGVDPAAQRVTVGADGGRPVQAQQARQLGHV
jgi:hypothetical protein